MSDKPNGNGDSEGTAKHGKGSVGLQSSAESMPVKPKRKARSTAENSLVLAERVQQVASWLADGKTRFDIHKLAAKRWGVCWKTSENYIAHARQYGIEQIGRPRADIIAEQYAHYRLIAQDNDKDRVSALRAIDDLLGLNAPRVIRVELEAKIIVAEIRAAALEIMPEKAEELIGRIKARLDQRRIGKACDE